MCVCGGVEVADGRTDGRCGPRKGGATVGKRICGLGISIFFLLLFYVLATAGEKNNRELLPILGL